MQIYKKKNPNLSFHPFPKKGQKIKIQNELFGIEEITERRKVWEIKLKMRKSATDSLSVCSLHFENSDYICSGWSSRKRLSSSAVPSKNLPKNDSNREEKMKSQEMRANRLMKRRLVSSTVTSENSVHDAKIENKCERKDSKDCGIQTTDTQYMDKGIQVNTDDVTTITDFIRSDSQLNSLTGLLSFKMLNRLVNYITPDKQIHGLSLHKRVCLFFMKLKLDLPYVVLSLLFGVSSQTCKRIFFDIAKELNPIARAAIPLTSKEEIMTNMPNCFSNFQNVRIVLDCTEMSVQRLCCRMKKCSHYKETNTIKFMTGVNSVGLITFVSRAYGGRCLNKAIFERSNLLEKLLRVPDAIMVDKGFLIEDLCDQFGIKLVRPPFLRDKKELSPEAVTFQNGKIARGRIERTNQRIKIFKIFRNPVPITLIPIIEDLFVIVCAIVNLSNPILANTDDDKFL